MSAGGGTRAVIAALAANMGIAVTKFGAFALTGSASMLAESIHSVADSGNQALLLIGAKRAKREATARHPFGFGRERYLYAFLVSIVLFSVGGLFALFEGYEKLRHPVGLSGRWAFVPMVILVVAVVLESLSFRTAIKETNKIRGTASWAGFIRHSRVPELPVVLLEDFAALIGLVFALLGVGLTLLTGSGVWDGLGTVLIGCLLIAVAVVLAIETKSLLIGESATAEDRDKLEAAVLAEPEISQIIHMRTMHLGPEELLVAIKIAVPEAAYADEIAGVIDRAEARMRAAVPIARVIYIEPDILRASKSATGEPKRPREARAGS